MGAKKVGTFLLKVVACVYNAQFSSHTHTNMTRYRFIHQSQNTISTRIIQKLKTFQNHNKKTLWEYSSLGRKKWASSKMNETFVEYKGCGETCFFLQFQYFRLANIFIFLFFSFLFFICCFKKCDRLLIELIVNKLQR